MPLYVTNGKLQLGEPGKLAAQRACCCNEEGDNPEDCVCPDFCIFKVEIVSPFQLTTPADPCESQRNITGAELGVCVDLDLEYPEFNGQPCQMVSEISSFANSLYAGVAVCHQTCGGITDGFGGGSTSARVPGTNLRAGIVYDALASIGCTDENSISARLILNISWRAVVVIYSADGFIAELSRRIIVKNSIVDPFEFLCAKKANATCLEGSDSSLIRAAYATSLPLNLTVSHDSPGLGSWGAESTDTQSGDQTHVTPYIEQIINDFAPTFRITQRPSCRIVDCNCSTSLDGLKATFEGKEFTLGTEEPYNEFFSGYELVTTHYKDFSGNYVFEKYKVLESPAGTIGDVQFATVYCETDEESDPPVPRWYVRFESICRQFAPDAETKRTEIGYLPCSESAGCAGRAEGDPVPLGSPIDIEEIEGSPETTDGLNACTPPARADLTIFEDCG